LYEQQRSASALLSTNLMGATLKKKKKEKKRKKERKKETDLQIASS